MGTAAEDDTSAPFEVGLMINLRSVAGFCASATLSFRPLVDANSTIRASCELEVGGFVTINAVSPCVGSMTCEGKRRLPLAKSKDGKLLMSFLSKVGAVDDEEDQALLSLPETSPHVETLAGVPDDVTFISERNHTDSEDRGTVALEVSCVNTDIATLLSLPAMTLMALTVLVLVILNGAV